MKRTIKVKQEMKECLENLRKATRIEEKLVWQNVYFWYVRNY